MEKLNIVGKRSGEGFVAHKATLVNALSRALADRVTLMDLTIGRKGLLGYLKSLGGSNVVKVIPYGNASGSQVADKIAGKQVKAICGANTSYLADMEWIGEKTPFTLCDIRVSPSNRVKPNIGAVELADALARVLPFTAKDDDRPVLQCVKFVAKDSKLTLVSADGFRLAVVTLDYDDGEGEVLINRDDLKGMVNALKRAKRARVSFEPGGETIGGYSLIIDTELIPTEFNTVAHLDTVEAIKTVNSLKALSDSKAYPIDLTIGNGMVVMANPDDKGQAELTADTDGEGFVRIDGQYLAEALKACGGMVDFKLTNATSPMLFTVDGYKLVVMPMLTTEANEQAKAEREAEAEQAEPDEELAEALAESIAVNEQAEQPTTAWGEAEKRAKVVSEELAKAEQSEPTKPVAEKPKGKRSRAKEPVAVAK